MSASRKRAATLALLAAGAITVSACGSTSSSSSGQASSGSASSGSASNAAQTSSSGSNSAGMAAAKQVVDQFASVPSGIPITTPLPRKPAVKTIGWLQPDVPAGTVLTPGFQAATKALGWNLKIIPLNPLQPGAAMQQAIDEGVNYIAIVGDASALYAPQLKNAQAKGIPVMSCYDDTPPTGSLSGSGPYYQCGGTPTAQSGGRLLADWAITHSSGKAKVVVFNVNSYPNLVVQAKAFHQELSKNCPSCSFSTQSITLDQLAKGQIPQIVSSFLQSNPQYNYIYFTFSNPPEGVASALQSAGLLQNRCIFGLDFNASRLNGVIQGKECAWTGLPKQYSAWLMVDAMVRLSEHQSIQPDVSAAEPLPQVLIDSPAKAKPWVSLGSWPGPTGYQQDFTKLWHVS